MTTSWFKRCAWRSKMTKWFASRNAGSRRGTVESRPRQRTRAAPGSPLKGEEHHPGGIHWSTGHSFYAHRKLEMHSVASVPFSCWTVWLPVAPSPHLVHMVGRGSPSPSGTACPENGWAKGRYSPKIPGFSPKYQPEISETRILFENFG
jgi:hypothetical protein